MLQHGTPNALRAFCVAIGFQSGVRQRSESSEAQELEYVLFVMLNIFWPLDGDSSFRIAVYRTRAACMHQDVSRQKIVALNTVTLYLKKSALNLAGRLGGRSPPTRIEASIDSNAYFYLCLCFHGLMTSPKHAYCLLFSFAVLLNRFGALAAIHP